MSTELLKHNNIFEREQEMVRQDVAIVIYWGNNKYYAKNSPSKTLKLKHIG